MFSCGVYGLTVMTQGCGSWNVSSILTRHPISIIAEERNGLLVGLISQRHQVRLLYSATIQAWCGVTVTQQPPNLHDGSSNLSTKAIKLRIVRSDRKCGRARFIAPALKADDPKGSVSSNLTASATHDEHAPAGAFFLPARRVTNAEFSVDSHNAEAASGPMQTST